MLCRKFKQISAVHTNNHVAQSLISSRFFSRRCLDFIHAVRSENYNMSATLRFKHLKDLFISRFFNDWTRSYVVSNVVRRCRRDRGVREVLQRFRQAFYRPRRALMLSVVAAASKKKRKDHQPSTCERNITDEEMQALVNELDSVEELSRATLYCENCALRVTLDKRHPGVRYCACSDAKPPQHSYKGWVPYMEAEDVIIWRKEYKKGEGLYAYKVYGRYKEVRAEDFAAIQVDGAYRRAWDTAVAALSVVERQANGVLDQTVLHWEVLWPRLFANRDYVYIRRHKEFNIKSRCLAHKEGIFNPGHNCEVEFKEERPNVHSNAKRKAMEQDRAERNAANQSQFIDNKVYVIVSRSCVHSQVPVTNNAIRVTEYWSRMVVKTLDGPDKPGAEFVLTYYDEPAVGGMPTAITSFATGRAAPAFLARMRQAAIDYRAWRARNHHEAPDFTPFGPEKVSYDKPAPETPISEEEMESSKQGPDLDKGYKATHDQSTQTEDTRAVAPAANDLAEDNEETSEDDELDEEEEDEPEEEHAEDEPAKAVVTQVSYTRPESIDSVRSNQNNTKENVKPKDAIEIVNEKGKSEEESEGEEKPEENTKSSWWRYLYPFYYFV